MSRRRDRPGPKPTQDGLAYRHNDGGRAAAGVLGKGGDDHLVRAIAILTGEDYRAVRKAAAAAMRENGLTPTGKASAGWKGSVGRGPRLARRDVEESVLRQFGFERVHMPPRSPRPTLAEAHIAHGDCIVEIAGGRASMKRRLCALAGGALRDVRDVRTYRWQGPATGDGNRPVEVRERKAQAIWVRR